MYQQIFGFFLRVDSWKAAKASMGKRLQTGFDGNLSRLGRIICVCFWKAMEMTGLYWIGGVDGIVHRLAQRWGRSLCGEGMRWG